MANGQVRGPPAQLAMVAFHASVLDGVARNPSLPTALLLRLLAFDGGGDRPP
ncbi:hypothetical protein ABZ865_21340 [Streptomyces sp. NPDC047085]|uniref:hypothetical protein n=1 Tax=Streptomyces sp. NPDC047085 TaxID=3155140 RepID=UPI003405D781